MGTTGDVSALDGFRSESGVLIMGVSSGLLTNYASRAAVSYPDMYLGSDDRRVSVDVARLSHTEGYSERGLKDPLLVNGLCRALAILSA
jgi:hypothetical protein